MRYNAGVLRGFGLVLRILALTAGKDAIARAMPFYLGMGLVAAVIFGGNGMHPSQLTDLAATSAPFRLGLWAAWLLVGAPAARALLRAPATFFLRALPIPRALLLSAHALLLAIAELPWIALWLLGAGALSACAACAGALAAHGLLLARPRGALEISSLALLAGGISLGASAPLLLACAAPALAVGLRAAFLRAPELGAAREPTLVAPIGGALPSLSLAYLASLLRGHRAVLVRGLALTAIGALAGGAWVRTSGPLETEPLAAASLVAFVPAALFAAAGFSGPVLREERRLAWLLDACGTPAPLRAGASAAAIAAPTAALGLAHGAALGALSRAPAAALPRLLGGAWLAGVLLTGVAFGCVRWAVRQDGRDSGRVLLAMFAAVTGATVIAWIVGELALAVWAPAAALLAWPPGLLRSASRRGGASAHTGRSSS